MHNLTLAPKCKRPKNEAIRLQTELDKLAKQLEEIQNNCEHDYRLAEAVEAYPTLVADAYIVIGAQPVSCLKCSAENFIIDMSKVCLRCFSEVALSQKPARDFDGYSHGMADLQGCPRCGFTRVFIMGKVEGRTIVRHAQKFPAVQLKPLQAVRQLKYVGWKE
ncbi:MAG: hypothetical protein WCG99_00375 [Candidatus Berkelbacteria bacterium]